MDATALTRIVTELIVALHAVSGYPVPETLPVVQAVPQSEIQARVCNGPCRVPAYYDPAVGVVIDEKLNLERDVFAQSILLHELVHHAQQVSGKFDAFDTECRRRGAEEAEAYALQNRFLSLKQAQQRVPQVRPDALCR